MAKLMALTLIIFSLVALGVSSGTGVLQTVAVAQNLEDDGDAEEDELGQEVDNESTTTQDSSSDDNVLENNNDFRDDIAAIGQDNDADQDAANVGPQDQDTIQELDQEQDAANVNVDFDIQVAQQVEQQQPLSPPPPTTSDEEPQIQPPPDDEEEEEQPPTESPPPPPPPADEQEFCFLGTEDIGEDLPIDFVGCAATLEECQALEQEFKGGSRSIEFACGESGPF
jgi:hypothetical protein